LSPASNLASSRKKRYRTMRYALSPDALVTFFSPLLATRRKFGYVTR